MRGFAGRLGHLAALLAGVGALLLGAGAPAAAQPLEKAKLSEVLRNLLYAPLYVAEDQGFFRTEGLDLEIITSGRRDLSMLSVLSGETQFNALDPAEPALARSKGAKVKVVAPVVMTLPVYIIAPEKGPVRSVDDLKGKTIVTGTAPTTSYSALQGFLRHRGFKEVEKDRWRPAGGSGEGDIMLAQVALPNEITVLKAGRADAANVYLPFQAIAAKTMATRTVYAYSTEGDFFFTGVSVSEDTLARNPKMVQRLVNALTRAFCFGHQSPEKAATIAVKYLPKLDPDVVRGSFLSMVKEGTYPRSPVISRPAFDNNFNKLLRETGHPAAGTKYEDLLDMTFASRAQAEHGCR
jgi:NitT/TauT family transport system substrate-binding protein